MVDKLKTVRMMCRFQVEEKAHYVIASGYLVPSVVFHGHSPVVTGVCYALAAVMTTHHLGAAKRAASAKRKVDDNG